MNEQHLSEINQLKYRYAGFWMRFWAYLLDLLIVISIHTIVTWPITGFTTISNLTLFTFSFHAVSFALVTLLYFLLLTKSLQQTIGKRVFGLKVVSNNGQSLTWSTLFFREVIGRYIIQAFTLSYLLYLIVPFHRKKQGIHDMIGDTYVIHEE